MQGITTAIVVFIFICLVFPQYVKNRPQFIVIIGLVLLMIFFDCIGNLADPTSGFRKFIYLINGVCQIIAILLLVLSTGGQSLGELGEEMGKTMEIIRHGSDPADVIVPLTGEQPKPPKRGPGSASTARQEDQNTSIPMD